MAGGIVTEATDIADMFLPKGDTIMVEADKTGEQKIIKSEKEPTKAESELKIVLLMNENTASSSEILIGALRENGRANTVGTKTFGKGIMQSVLPLSTGGALKLTIKEFFIPNEKKINEEGIVPDIEIEDDEETDKDEQLERAIEECKK